MNVKIGYARVSTDKQDTKAQVDALQKYGCDPIFQENASGARWDRPELHKALDSLGVGDTLVIWKLDRLSRSLSDMLNILTQIQTAGAHFESLTERIDTASAAGELMMHMLLCFAQFERSIIRERTKLGIARARAAGTWNQSKIKLNPNQQREAIKMVKSGDKSQAEVAKLFNVNRSTICRLLSERRVLERIS